MNKAFGGSIVTMALGLTVGLIFGVDISSEPTPQPAETVEVQPEAIDGPHALIQAWNKLEPENQAAICESYTDGGVYAEANALAWMAKTYQVYNDHGRVVDLTTEQTHTFLTAACE